MIGGRSSNETYHSFLSHLIRYKFDLFIHKKIDNKGSIVDFDNITFCKLKMFRREPMHLAVRISKAIENFNCIPIFGSIGDLNMYLAGDILEIWSLLSEEATIIIAAKGKDSELYCKTVKNLINQWNAEGERY